MILSKFLYSQLSLGNRSFHSLHACRTRGFKRSSRTFSCLLSSWCLCMKYWSLSCCLNSWCFSCRCRSSSSHIATSLAVDKSGELDHRVIYRASISYNLLFCFLRITWLPIASATHDSTFMRTKVAMCEWHMTGISRFIRLKNIKPHLGVAAVCGWGSLFPRWPPHTCVAG